MLTEGLLQVQEVLAYIEERSLLPPMVVLQALAKNPHLTLAVVKGYIERQLTQVPLTAWSNQKCNLRQRCQPP